MNADKLSFDRLFDRAYQPVNNQPFGHNITLCCPHGLSVSFIAALSKWRKQFNLYLFLSFICVHLRPSLLQCFFQLFKIFFFTG